MKNNLIFLAIICVFSIALVLALTISPTSYSTIYNTAEQDGASPYLFNFSINVTLDEGETLINYSIDDSLNKIYLNDDQKTLSDITPWINMNYSSGILLINSTFDNRTGLLLLPLAVTVSTGSGTTTMRQQFNFTINATNDYPIFTDIQNNYNWSSGSSNFTITASDEEEHYPLNFSLTQINCTHAEWSGLDDDENCSIFTLQNLSDNSAKLGLSWNTNSVGTYYFYLNITEAGHECSTLYCNPDYTNNLTNSTLVKLDILSSLSVDASNCSNSILNEDEPFSCSLNITTKGESDDLDISTTGFFRNSPSTEVSNSSWFYSDSETSSTSFMKTIEVNVTPSKKDVGNWTINFTVEDTSSGESALITPIYLYVNYSESNVSLLDISDLQIYENTTFRVNATDDDLLIRDSSVKDEFLNFY